MSDEAPKRRPGRPRKEGDDHTFSVTIPKHHFDYLTFLAIEKHRLGGSAKEAAEHTLIRELDAMEQGRYHDNDFSTRTRAG
jgi:hypothetical protein